MIAPQEQIDRSPFYAKIPLLVRESMQGGGKKARLARRTLILGVTQDPFVDPLPLAVVQIQRYLLSVRNTGVLQAGVEFLEELIAGKNEAILQRGSYATIRIAPQVIKAAQGIIENNVQFERNPSIQSKLPSNYQNFRAIAPFILANAAKGVTRAEMTFARPASSGGDHEKRDQDKKHMEAWIELMSDAINESVNSIDKSGLYKQDNIIDLVKTEPEQDIYPERKLFTARFAGITLEEIESIPYPLSPEDQTRITNYVTEILSDNTSQLRRAIIEYLFFHSIYFNSPEGPIEYKYENLISRLSNWQENFMYEMYFEHDEEKERQTAKLLAALSEREATMLLASFLQWATHPLEFDHERPENLNQSRPYPVYDLAMDDHKSRMEERGASVEFIYGDEIARSYFQSTIVPRLLQRLETLGAREKFDLGFSVIAQVLESHPFSESHLAALRDIFERNVGGEFLGRLNMHATEIAGVANTVWQSTIEKGLHFLPTQQGISTVEFSQDSVPDILGLESITFNRSGTPQDWQINTVFKLRDTYIMIVGKLNDEGRLELKASLDTEIPGLYNMLNYIAVLTFNDLVVQESTEQEAEAPRGDRKGMGQKGRGEERKQVSVAASLPRKHQSDRQLIEDVYKITGFKRRSVDLHKRLLSNRRQIDEYKEAAHLYQEAMTTEVSEETRSWLAVELTEARKLLHKASETKKRTVPKRFQLETIYDPILEEDRYLETWVIDHTSPKPTEEELHSPVKMFERHYKRSSALASLDQMKPWFIGE